MSQNYYQVLGVDQGCGQEEIKNAYRHKIKIFHPDKLAALSEEFRQLAEEEAKKINQAYETLKNSQKRAAYNLDLSQRKAELLKPKPVVDPSSITFKNLKPGETKKASFAIQNIGGPYSNLWFGFSNPDTWGRIAKYYSEGSGQLPLRVEIEVEADAWDKDYSEEIIVKLDEEETRVKIRLHSKSEPIPIYSPPPSFSPPPPSYQPTPPPPYQPTSQPSSADSDTRMPVALKWLIGVGSIVFLIMVADTYHQSKSLQIQSQSQTRVQTQSQISSKPTTQVVKPTQAIQKPVQSTQNQIQDQPRSQMVQPVEPVKPVIPIPASTLLKERSSMYTHQLFKSKKESVDPQIETSLDKWIAEKLNLKMRWISFREWEGAISGGYFDVEDYAMSRKDIWVVGHGQRILSNGFGELNHLSCIIHSLDNGASWELQWRDLDNTNPFVVCFLNETEGWVGSITGLFSTQDGGRNWQLNTGPYHESGVIKNNKCRYWFYNNYRIVAEIYWGHKYESLDGGKTWKILPEQAP